MVRGGCWINNSDNARAAYRNNNHPDNHNNNIGFRLCCFSHIAPVLQRCWSQLLHRELRRPHRIASVSRIACRLRFARRGEELNDGAGGSCPHSFICVTLSGLYKKQGAVWIRPAAPLSCEIENLLTRVLSCLANPSPQ